MSNDLAPIKIEKITDKGIRITWRNQTVSTISAEKLRSACPCANCKELRGESTHSKPISTKPSSLRVIEHTKDEETTLKQIELVGNYGLSLRWADGHSAGIYTFEYLRQLS